MKGFVGKLLNVNLSTKEISDEILDDEVAKNFLGAAGYSCRYLYNKLNKETDPLSPENILMFMTGPFCGSNIPTSGRFTVCAKSPYTGLWGESNCGGFFGPELKKAGYDGIVIKGASDNPVYLEIIDSVTEIKDATKLWGKGTLETTEILKNIIDNLARVACIGPAGENLVKYATIASEEKAAGRTGMGAVMGSKKLKAIIVKGKKKKYEAADPDGFKEIAKRTIDFVKNSFITTMMSNLGTGGALDMYNVQGELPIKYWTQAQWDDSYNISGATASEKIYTRSYPCFACPIGCAKKAEIKEGEYKTNGEVESPEYETLAGFGSMILNSNLESIVHANYLCNDLGIDTISGSSTIAFIYYLFNEGKINSNDIDGLNPKWGDPSSMLELIKKIAKREGIGDLLAEGSDAIGKKFNISQEKIATVYGMEVPYHDLRSCFGMAVTYGLGSPRGPCHNSSDMYNILLGIPLQDFGIEMIEKYRDDEVMAKMGALGQNYRALSNSLIMCVFANPEPKFLAKLINTALGIDCTIETLKKFGERIYMIKRLFNLKMGITPIDDRLPKILLEPKDSGDSAGKTPNFQSLKEGYYKFRTFDLNTGIPSDKKLKALDLNNIKN
ncbi:MAG: aldehyde ferredoxin oxidoreductase family protein [Candidatus Odinarchaeota archaeon]